MSSTEKILKLEQESEESKKIALLKRKQRKLRFIVVAIVGSLALLLLFTPTGLQAIGNFCKSRYQNKCFRTIFQKTTDLLWVYGYYEETLPNYRYIYENTDENSNLELVQQNFYNVALNYYYMGHFGTSKLLFLVFKARWPIADKILLNQIDKRLKILKAPNGHEHGYRPPDWVLELADQYIIPESQKENLNKK